MASREQNERRYQKWEERPDGGRIYTRKVNGRDGGYALYLKTVNTDEITLRMVQEIYDNRDRLIGVHEKYPVDKGHIHLPVEDEE